MVKIKPKKTSRKITLPRNGLARSLALLAESKRAERRNKLIRAFAVLDIVLLLIVGVLLVPSMEGGKFLQSEVVETDDTDLGGAADLEEARALREAGRDNTDLGGEADLKAARESRTAGRSGNGKTYKSEQECKDNGCEKQGGRCVEKSGTGKPATGASKAAAPSSAQKGEESQPSNGGDACEVCVAKCVNDNYDDSNDDGSIDASWCANNPKNAGGCEEVCSASNDSSVPMSSQNTNSYNNEGSAPKAAGSECFSRGGVCLLSDRPNDVSLVDVFNPQLDCKNSYRCFKIKEENVLKM